MKKYQTRKKRSPPKNTRKNRRSRLRKGGGIGDQTLYLVSSESITRPGYPTTRVISTEGDGEGGFMSFERYLSDITNEVEEELLAIKQNQFNKITPKRAIVKKVVIRKPAYLPSKF